LDYKHTPTPSTPSPRVWIATRKIPTAGTLSKAFSSREKAERWLMDEVNRHVAGRLEVSIEHYFVDDKK